MSTPVTPSRTFPDLLAARLQHRPGPTPAHGVRRRHRRTHRALGDHLRQLGEQDRQPVHRRARARRRRHRAPRPAGPLAGAGVPRRRVERRARRHDRSRRAPRPRRLRPGLGSAGTTGAHGRRLLAAALRGAVQRAAAGRRSRLRLLWPGQSDVFVALGPAEPRHPRVERRGRHPDPGRAARGSAARPRSRGPAAHRPAPGDRRTACRPSCPARARRLAGAGAPRRGRARGPLVTRTSGPRAGCGAAVSR